MIRPSSKEMEKGMLIYIYIYIRMYVCIKEKHQKGGSGGAALVGPGNVLLVDGIDLT